VSVPLSHTHQTLIKSSIIALGKTISILYWLLIAQLQAHCSTFMPQFPHLLNRSNKTSPGGTLYTLAFVEHRAKESTTATTDPKQSSQNSAKRAADQTHD